MSGSVEKVTPLMRQYHAIKNQYPNTILLFQVGDFYELFFEDAQKAAAFLGIALTQRGMHEGQPIPLCGVPRHTLDHYLIKLVRGGFRVAICDQLTAAVAGKMVERGVTQVLTPGTLTDVKLLDEKSASYIAALFPLEEQYGLVFAELLTGTVQLTVIPRTDQKLLEAELARFMPHEIVLPQTIAVTGLTVILQRCGYITTLYEVTSQKEVFDCWLQSRASEAARSFIEYSDVAYSALHLLYHYLAHMQPQALQSMHQLMVYAPEDFLLLDAATQRNLELVKNNRDGGSAHTVFSVIDGAVTAMGSRLLKKWLLRPLINQEQIEHRLAMITLFYKNHAVRNELSALLRACGDIERVVGRIALRRAHLNDYLLLIRALSQLPDLIRATQQLEHNGMPVLRIEWASLMPLYELCMAAFNDDSSQDWLIKSGYHAELDRLRTMMHASAQIVHEMECAEQVATGINSLKIRYNSVHGYGIEVTKPNIHLVPPHYIRLQTLINRERFTTQALKDLEYDIERARTTMGEIEKEVFAAVCAQVEAYVPLLKQCAHELSTVDAWSGLAHIAYERGYVRPEIISSGDLVIKEGRHPVIDVTLQHHFIPNDTHISDTERLWIITGPNMGGKSTYMRQVALISILAHMGSFVPAQQAVIPLLDRIFTRIGAADDVAAGKSTFLVEMEETALICTQATARSLVILDEVGRGTSTYDGLAIAQAVIEYINSFVQARCLFATHYHELTALAEQLPGIVAYHAATAQVDGKIVLLHKILPGVAPGSFGLEVAKMAQLPAHIITRAHALLTHYNTL